MYTEFSIKNYRCFDQLSLPDLPRFNLITGENNTGKTALLEAIFLHCGAYRPELTVQVNALRGVEEQRVQLLTWAETLWDPLFLLYDKEKTIVIEAKKQEADEGTSGKPSTRILQLNVVRHADRLEKLDLSIKHGPSSQEDGSFYSIADNAQVLELHSTQNGRERTYYMVVDAEGTRTVPIPPSPPFPAVFIPARSRVRLNEDAERFSNLAILGRQDVVRKALHVIEPRLKRLDVFIGGAGPMIHGDIGLGRSLPLPFMGEGMGRLASLVLAIANCENGVVLIDEIENGLHHSVLEKVWSAIAKIARDFQVQVFATTHSWECITAAHESFKKAEEYDFRLCRLERRNGKLQAIAYDRNVLEAAIETGMEVR